MSHERHQSFVLSPRSRRLRGDWLWPASSCFRAEPRASRPATTSRLGEKCLWHFCADRALLLVHSAASPLAQSARAAALAAGAQLGQMSG